MGHTVDKTQACYCLVFLLLVFCLCVHTVEVRDKLWEPFSPSMWVLRSNKARLANKGPFLDEPPCRKRKLWRDTQMLNDKTSFTKTLSTLPYITDRTDPVQLGQRPIQDHAARK